VDAQLTAIMADIRAHLGDWYPEAGPRQRPDLRVVFDDARALNRVLRIDVRAGGRSVARLIVKTSTPDPDPLVTADDRPRLVPVTSLQDRPALEFDALRLIEDRLAQVGDDRFVPVRALGVLAESSAFVMEVFPGRPLHRLLLPSVKWRKSPHLRPAALVSAAGRWLRILHDTPTDGSQESRQETADELAESFAAFGSFLVRTGAPKMLDEVVDVGKAAISTVGDMPLVLSHGDFAPRNILVDRRGRLAVIDLLGRWRAPRYEDVAAFLVSLHTSRANAATQGIVFGRGIDRLEPAFLEGYFGADPIARFEVRLFELLLLLDKWSARTIRVDRAGGGVRERMIDRHFATRARHLARTIAADL
jgi:aminoglycoside phosphotransferase (APT) family kinase protein